MMDLDSRRSNFPEKSDTEVGLPVPYSSTHNITVNRHAPIFLHKLDAHARYAFS